MKTEPLFKKVNSKERNPNHSGWYDTNDGNLYWRNDDKEWSCREDRVSEEYPQFWYEAVSQPPAVTKESLFKSKEKAIEWVRSNIPFAVKPLKKAKTDFIYPFASYHAQMQVVEGLAEELFELSSPLPDNSGAKIPTTQGEREKEIKAELRVVRNKLYDQLPTGDIDSWELLKTVQRHLKELDFLIDYFDSTAKPESNKK